VAGPPAFPARLEPDCSGRTLRLSRVRDGKKSRIRARSASEKLNSPPWVVPVTFLVLWACLVILVNGGSAMVIGRTENPTDRMQATW
jgi:hypothetical protein